MKWTEEETVKFTQLYHENDCLWNLTSPCYKDRIKRQKAVEKIVQEMKQCFPVRFSSFGNNEVKQKIKNLRSTYNQELSKIKNARSKADELYTSSLKWFFIMDNIMKHSKGSTYFQIKDDLADDFHDFDGEDIYQRNNPTFYEQSYEISYETVPQEAVLTKPDNLCIKSKLRGVKRKLPDLLSAIDELRAASKAISASKYDMSETKAFGNYVAKSLDRLKPCEAIMCQQEIQTVITNYRLRQAQDISGHETVVD